MTLSFEQHPDWLSYTLANGERAPEPRRFQQQQADGTLIGGCWLAPGILQLLPLGDAEGKGTACSRNDSAVCSENDSEEASWILSAGIHGNETAPIEWLNQFLQDWRQGQWCLHKPLLLILGNLQAMQRQQRFVTTNLNRLFAPFETQTAFACQDSVSHKGSYQNHPDQQHCYESARALVIQQAIDQHFNAHSGIHYHWDLHTAIRGSHFERFALCPERDNPKISAQSYAQHAHLLEQAGIEALVSNDAIKGSTLSFYTAFKHHAISATLELGKVRAFGENTLEPLERLTTTLISQLSQQPLETPHNLQTKKPLCTKKTRMKRFKVAYEIIRHSEAFEWYVEDEVLNFTAFLKGALLAKDQDRSYQVARDQEYMLFPNPNVELGHRVAVIIFNTDS